MALINLRNALMSDKRLPYDAEVEYLVSDGSAWLNTGVKIFSDTKVEATFYNNYTTTAATYIFGSDITTERFYFREYQGCASFSTGVWWQNTSISIIGTHTVTMNNNGLVIDSTSSFRAEGDAKTGAGTLLLFKARTYSVTPAGVRIYSLKVYSGTVLVRDLIPVRVGTVGYLYDRVSGKLFGNAGTGDFVVGPDVVPVEYLGGDGNAYIDTGIANDNNLEIYAEAKIPTFTDSKAIFGVMGTAGQTTTQRLITARESSSAYWIILQRAQYGYGGRNRIAWDGDWHEYWLSKSTAKIDSSQKASADIASNTSETIYLFAGNYGGTVMGQCACLIRRFTISNSGTLILRYLPVRVGTEGAMMDVLTRRIYRNAGTGAFTYGNDLKYPIPAA